VALRRGLLPRAARGTEGKQLTGVSGEFTVRGVPLTVNR
jgi:hypothetical protein